MDAIKEARNEMDAILSVLHMHAAFGEIREFVYELRNAERFMAELIAEKIVLKERILDLQAIVNEKHNKP